MKNAVFRKGNSLLESFIHSRLSWVPSIITLFESARQPRLVNATSTTRLSFHSIVFGQTDLLLSSEVRLEIRRSSGLGTAAVAGIYRIIVNF